MSTPTRNGCYGAVTDWPHTPRMEVRSHEQAMRETRFLEVDDLAWLRSLRNWLSNEEWDLLMVPKEPGDAVQERIIHHLDKSSIRLHVSINQRHGKCLMRQQVEHKKISLSLQSCIRGAFSLCIDDSLPQMTMVRPSREVLVYKSSEKVFGILKFKRIVQCRLDQLLRCCYKKLCIVVTLNVTCLELENKCKLLFPMYLDSGSSHKYSIQWSK